MPEEKQIIVDGDVVKEITSIEKQFDKAEYLAQKEAELIAHDEGVKAYNEAQANVREKLVDTINELKK